MAKNLYTHNQQQELSEALSQVRWSFSELLDHLYDQSFASASSLGDGGWY